jgi:hypothetical protein
MVRPFKKYCLYTLCVCIARKKMRFWTILVKKNDLKLKSEKEKIGIAISVYQHIYHFYKEKNIL